MLAKKLWTVLAAISAGLAGLAAKHAIEFAWREATGSEPPRPESPETDWTDAVRYAALSAAVLAVAQLLARRFLAEGWQAATGELPPGLEAES